MFLLMVEPLATNLGRCNPPFCFVSVSQASSLFEFWLITAAPPKLYLLYTQEGAPLNDQPRVLPAETQEKLVQEGAALFYGWLVHAAAQVSQSGYRQLLLFFATLFSRFFGLSRSGVSFLGTQWAWEFAFRPLTRTEKSSSAGPVKNFGVFSFLVYCVFGVERCVEVNKRTSVVAININLSCCDLFCVVKSS